MDLRKLYKKYQDVIPYLFFGVCTTLVNVIVYWLSAHFCGLKVMPSTILAWVLAVLFAYVTNRKWVFHSEVYDTNGVFREIASFFMARLLTGIIDWGCMYIFVNKLMFNDVVIKFIANIIVIILNYIASKLVIFKKVGNN